MSVRSALLLLAKRQNGAGTLGDDGEDGDDGDGYDDNYSGYGGGSWWWTPTGMAIRYTLASLIFAAALLFLVGGYLHARRRAAQGLPPLPYHRWMLGRQRRHNNNNNDSSPYSQRYYAHYQQPPHQQHQQQQQQGYMMNDYLPPPPAYHTSELPPPVYQPPEGGSKVLADQQGYVRVDLGGEGPVAPGAVARS
ncbi:hypothetical protein LTR08_001152 [Meristemomyces frigidus]|nr:hypothetical protein LTR08_001152 [Meristemomyces frigidus]